ncbi:alanine--tRNA ligase-related protein [Candidatus Mycoplasma haematominutum]|uniref:alanine--tRNA ligase n=1 Tax=Candidatus Mycoplasma haematominutum 'Birmingham 1' TaxID=1116213 RepID=G8C2Z1_9MOLU|nr:alanine--tRNA ligase-related protein [Candidatus Mycoplasma haematominutum]CCE66689.1 alanyl-tRNA synthetase [Candidatus Mycoplasma haematominutum 'Birmingham 1']
MNITALELRDAWLNFFREREHQIVPPLSLIPPQDDKSTLFINSGLCAIKKEFISQDSSTPKMFTSVQKVVRTVDMSSIEKDVWHSTYFEMMGNFSIGGYFKKEAIKYAVEFLKNVLKIDASKLVVTIHKDDAESAIIWKEHLGEYAPILKLGKENFWEIGDGPCGPCTEIYYDRGRKYDQKGLGLQLIEKNIDNARYIEIWNIVFSQYWKKGNEYIELERKNIDTGAGFERLITILEQAENIYHSSLFKPLIEGLERFTHFRYFSENDSLPDHLKSHFQVAADHLRTATILLSEGVVPDKKGRGYVVRKLLRRAFVSICILEILEVEPAIVLLSQIAIKSLLPIHPELKKNVVWLQDQMLLEYKVFFKILRNMEHKIEKSFKSSHLEAEQKIFTLIEREGVPLPLIEKVLGEKKINFSRDKLDQLLMQHQQKSKNEKFSDGFELAKN